MHVCQGNTRRERDPYSNATVSAKHQCQTTLGIHSSVCRSVSATIAQNFVRTKRIKCWRDQSSLHDSRLWSEWRYPHPRLRRSDTTPYSFWALWHDFLAPPAQSIDFHSILRLRYQYRHISEVGSASTAHLTQYKYISSDSFLSQARLYCTSLHIVSKAQNEPHFWRFTSEIIGRPVWYQISRIENPISQCCLFNHAHRK
jgi:hypothetical protein